MTAGRSAVGGGKVVRVRRRTHSPLRRRCLAGHRRSAFSASSYSGRQLVHSKRRDRTSPPAQLCDVTRHPRWHAFCFAIGHGGDPANQSASDDGARPSGGARSRDAVEVAAVVVAKLALLRANLSTGRSSRVNACACSRSMRTGAMGDWLWMLLLNFRCRWGARRSPPTRRDPRSRRS
jgi:hypothetical protein